ncbi:MAG: M56 family metallopeptidase, partial [Planctomycetota bacterium]
MMWLDVAVCERLCLSLLHSLWQVTILAVAAWLVGAWLGHRRQQASYIVHVTVLVLACLSAPLNYLVLMGVSADPGFVAVESATAPVVVGDDVVNSDLPFTSTRSMAIESTTDELKTPAPRDFKETQPVSATFDIDSFMPWITLIYFFGVVVMLIRLTWSGFQVERLRLASKAVTEGNALDAMRRVCEQWSLRRQPMLSHAETVLFPKVVGLFKPTILLPTSALTGLRLEDLEMILAHEIAHVRRFDLWVNLFQRLAEAVLFFNPAVWWLSRRVSTIREYCCDDDACSVFSVGPEQNLRYAEALLRVIDSRCPDLSQPLTALAATGGSPSEIRRRVARLLDEPMKDPIQISRNGFIVTAGFALLFIAPIFAQSRSQESETDGSIETALLFPKDQSVGTIYVRSNINGGFGFDDDYFSNWSRLGAAQGEVRLEADQQVRLDVSKARSTDLAFLDEFAPDAIDWLSLEGTDVNDRQLRHVGKLTGLQLLNLESTRVTNSGIKELAKLKKLQNLNLSAWNTHDKGYDVGDDAMPILASLPELEVIRLRRSKITDDGLAELSKCRSLRSIGIEGTEVTDAGLPPLLKLPNLRSLSLGVYREGTAVTDEGLKVIGQIETLEYLSLSSTEITNSGLK